MLEDYLTEKRKEKVSLNYYITDYLEAHAYPLKPLCVIDTYFFDL